MLWGEADAFFFCRGGNIDGEAVNCETVVDEDVISQSVYLSGLVIAYNPSGCLNKGSLLFNFWADCRHYLEKKKKKPIIFYGVGAILLGK